MAETLRRRRRICYRSAGAWATAAPPPPLASPPPALLRNRPLISSPESTSRRRCRWLRTQVSVRPGRVRCGRPCRSRQQRLVQRAPAPSLLRAVLGASVSFPCATPSGPRFTGLVAPFPAAFPGLPRVTQGSPRAGIKPSLQLLATLPHPSAEVNSAEASFLRFAFTSLRRSASETPWRFLQGQNDCVAGGGGQGASGPRIREQCAPGER